MLFLWKERSQLKTRNVLQGSAIWRSLHLGLEGPGSLSWQQANRGRSRPEGRRKHSLVWETASFSRGGNLCACLPCPSEVDRGIVVEGPECLGIQWDLPGSSWQRVRADKTLIRLRLYLNHQHSQGKPSARCGRLGINQPIPNGGASPGKESSRNAGDTGDVDSIPGSGRSPWVGRWQHTPVSLPEKSHG